MTSLDLIAFIRSKVPDTWWDFHGPSITKAVEQFEQSVREEVPSKPWLPSSLSKSVLDEVPLVLPGFVSRKLIEPERVELL